MIQLWPNMRNYLNYPAIGGSSQLGTLKTFLYSWNVVTWNRGANNCTREAITGCSLASQEHDNSKPELVNLLAERFALMAALKGRAPPQPAYPVLEKFFCKHKKEEIPERELFEILIWLLALTACSLASQEYDNSNPELANLLAERFPLMAALMGLLEKFFCKHKKEEIPERELFEIFIWFLAITGCSLASQEHDNSKPELVNLLAERFPLMAALKGRAPPQPAYPVLEKFFCKHKKEEIPERELFEILIWLLALTACSLASQEYDNSNPELANLLAERFPLMAALMGRAPPQPAYPVPIIVTLPMVSEYGLLEKFFCKHKHKDKKEEIPERDQEESDVDHDGDGEDIEEAEPLHPPYPLPPPPPYHPPGYKPKPTTTAKPIKVTTVKPVKTTSAKPVKTTTAKPVKTTTKRRKTTTTKPTTTTTTTTPCPTHPPEDNEDYHPEEEDPSPPGYPPHPPGYPVLPYPQPTTTTTTTTTAKPKPTRPVWWSIFTTPKPKSVKSPTTVQNSLRKIEEIIQTAAAVETDESKGKETTIETIDYDETKTPEDTTLRGEELAENP